MVPFLPFTINMADGEIFMSQRDHTACRSTRLLSTSDGWTRRLARSADDRVDRRCAAIDGAELLMKQPSGAGDLRAKILRLLAPPKYQPLDKVELTKKLGLKRR